MFRFTSRREGQQKFQKAQTYIIIYYLIKLSVSYLQTKNSTYVGEFTDTVAV